MPNMYYGQIKKFDIADGLGVRVSLFVSGCMNACKNCFQPETWNFEYGNPYTQEVQDIILAALAPSYIQGLTILGGEPFELSNQSEIVKLLREVREKLPQKNIWIYTGYILDQDLLEGGRRHGPYTDEILSLIDILVDGPFIDEKKNISLAFRGSENQRLIDMKASLAAQDILLFEPEKN
jgi:anaerobic ribonucleoside-triphosphate reductase activating protein